MPVLRLPRFGSLLCWAVPGSPPDGNSKAAHSAQVPIEVEASDEGLFFHSAYAESKISRSAYVAWGENKATFVILPQPRTYFPIPKRAFTPEQLEDFRSILRRNVSKK